MSAKASYGTQRGAIAKVLDAVGDSAMVLSCEEDRAFAAQSLSRFGAVGSTRLGWNDADVIERSTSFDGEELRRMVRGHADAHELAVVFWSNLAAPSIALESALVAAHAESVLQCSPECWVYFVDSGVLIEFQDGDGLIAGRVPQ